MLYGCSLALSTTLSSTVTIWCVFHVDCSALDPHTGVEWHSAFRHRAHPQLPLSSISAHVPVASTCDACTQMEPRCSVPPTRHATAADASTQLSISEFLQLCFIKHPFWQTVPLHIHEDLREAQTPSHPGNTIPATFADAATQLSFAEFLEGCNLSSAPQQRPRSSRTLLMDAATQTPPHSAASADATTQLTLTEFFLGCIHSKDPLDRRVPPPTHGRACNASLPQPSDIATVTSCTSGRHVCTPVSLVRLHSSPPPPPGLEEQASLCSPHGILVKAAPVPPRSQNIHLNAVPAATCKYRPRARLGSPHFFPTKAAPV